MPTATDSSRSDRPWIKPRDLAAREGVDRRTVWRWIEKGAVEVSRVGQRTGVRVRMGERERC